MKSPKNARISAGEAGQRFVLSEYRFPCRERGNRGRYPRDGNVKNNIEPRTGACSADAQLGGPKSKRYGLAKFSRRVCLLSPHEESLLQSGIHPLCRNHKHVTRSEAVEMVRPDLGMPSDSPSRPKPVARWLDSRRIVLIQAPTWQVSDSDGMPVLQLLPIGSARKSDALSRICDRRK